MVRIRRFRPQRMVYDPRAFATSISNPDERFMARTDYDRNGRPTAQYVPRHDSTNHSNLDATGTQAAQCPTTVDPAGSPGYPSDVGVCVTRVGYDEAGNRATLVLPTAAGAAVSPPPAKRIDFTYSDDNRPVAVDAPNPTGSGRVTAVRYLHDGDGMTLRAIDANNNARTTTYTADNLVASETGQPGAGAVTHLTRYTYNANAARTTVLDAAGQPWTTSYTTDDRQYRVADPMGNTTEYGYDAVGNPTSVLRPEGYTRRAAGQPYGADISEFSFDNLLAATTRPVTHDGAQRRRVDYGYDAAGRKTSQRTATINPAGAVTGDGGTQWFAWHPNGLAASETGRNGEGIAYTYDPAGNMVAATDSTHRETDIANTWFLDGTLRSTTSGSDVSRYGYDGAGSVTFRQYETTGRSIVGRYAYNDAGLPATSALDGQSGQYAWRYDPAGRTVEIDYPTGQDILLGWNTDDTLATHTARTATGTSLAAFTYTYDNLSRQVTQAHTTLAGVGGTPVTDTLHYKYDLAGRLDEWRNGATVIDVDHDRDANRTRVGTDVFTYNADDTLATTTVGGTTRTSTYDPAGRLSTDGCRTQGYDGFDRTTQAAPQAGATGCGTQPTVTWRYDPLDRQRARTESGSSTRATTYSYDGLTQTETLETDQGTQRGWYIDPTGTRRAHVTYGAVTATTMLFDDGQANTSTVTNTAGTVDCTLRYDPWGNPLNPRAADNPCNSGTAPNTILYNGVRRDRTNGTYQFGSRTYDPTKAAFTTPDSYRADNWNKDLSIGTDPLTQNRYTYVNGDPINLTDPTGHIPEECHNGTLSCSNKDGKWTMGPPTTGVTVSGRTYYLTDRQLVQANVRLGGSSNCGVSRAGHVTYWYPERDSCGFMFDVYSNSLRQRVANTLGGVVEGLTAGNTKTLLGLIGAENKVNFDSTEFKFAERATIAADFAIGVGAAVKGVRALRAARAAKIAPNTAGAGVRGLANAGDDLAQGGVYALRDPVTGQVVRTGRTNNLTRRSGEHFRDPRLSDYEFEVVARTDVYAQQRGLEQLVHNAYNPALNRINPISATNPNRGWYGTVRLTV